MSTNNKRLLNVYYFLLIYKCQQIINVYYLLAFKYQQIIINKNKCLLFFVDI